MTMPVNPDAIAFLECFLAIGLFSLVCGFWQRWRELSPRNWLQISGSIDTSRIDKQYAGKGRNQFVPVIEYEYRHDEQTFKSSRRRIGNYVSGKRGAAEAVNSRYPVGGSVKVFINPKNPTKSVLEYGVTPLSWISIALGAAFIAIALLPLLIK